MLIGNPLWDDFPELVPPDSHNCAEESVVAALRVLEDTGKKQYQDFSALSITQFNRYNLARSRKPQHKAPSMQGRRLKCSRPMWHFLAKCNFHADVTDGDLREFLVYEIVLPTFPLRFW